MHCPSHIPQRPRQLAAWASSDGAPHGAQPALLPDGDADRRMEQLPWVLLIVDDDDDVRMATQIALSTTRVHGRRVQLLFASSAADARQTLREVPAVDLLLLDIVMETPDAGLELAREIARQGVAAPRVILRTGQPGFWQDAAARRLPGIAGYLSKAELTRSKLVEALSNALPADA